MLFGLVHSLVVFVEMDMLLIYLWFVVRVEVMVFVMGLCCDLVSLMSMGRFVP